MKNFFYNDEKTKTPKVQKEQIKPVISTVHATSLLTHEDTEISSVSTGTAGKKEEYTKHLDDVMEKRNVPGPDYFEFKKALEDMKSSPLDEKTKFTSIFVGFHAMGITKEKLIDTAKVYIDAFGDVKNSFDKDCQDVIDGKIKNEEQNAINLEEENKKIDLQMIELNNKKLANTENAKKTREANSNRTNQLNSQKSDFESVYKEKVDEINRNIELINLYL
jgi:hypothetical protein